MIRAIKSKVVVIALLGTVGVLAAGCDNESGTTTTSGTSTSGTSTSGTSGGGTPGGGTSAGAIPPASGAAEAKTPKAVAKAMAEAFERGDVAAVKAMSTGGDANSKALEAMVGMIGNSKKLRDAATEKFGAEGKNIAGMGGSTMPDLAAQVDSSTEKVEGDTATLTSTEGNDPLTLKKVDGEWKVDLGKMTGNSAADAEKGAPMVQAISRVMSTVAEEVKAGKYKTVKEAQQAMQMMVAKEMGLPAGLPVPTPGEDGASGEAPEINLPDAPDGPDATPPVDSADEAAAPAK